MSSNGSFPRDRLKWTKELHDLFEKAVHQIGGPDRATPKGIMKAMGIPGLTIFHVKSHLQKYRMSIFTREEDHIRGKSERRSLSDMLPELGVASAAQLNEALQIQIEAQRRLSDQLEVQRSLKMKIEAQTKFLDNFIAEYNNRTASYKPVKPHSPKLSLPSLIEEFESESEEACTSKLMTGDECRASKRFKSQDTNNSYGMFPVNVMNNNNKNNNLYENQEIDFSWNVGAFELSLMRDTYNP